MAGPPSPPYPWTPVPATVVMIPSGPTRRTRLFDRIRDVEAAVRPDGDPLGPPRVASVAGPPSPPYPDHRCRPPS